MLRRRLMERSRSRSWSSTEEAALAKHFLTYHAGEADPKRTQNADLVFEDGVELEVPPERHWLWWKLQGNPFFCARVEADEPVPEAEGADTNTAPGPPNVH